LRLGISRSYRDLEALFGRPKAIGDGRCHEPLSRHNRLAQRPPAMARLRALSGQARPPRALPAVFGWGIAQRPLVMGRESMPENRDPAKPGADSTRYPEDTNATNAKTTITASSPAACRGTPRLSCDASTPHGARVDRRCGPDGRGSRRQASDGRVSRATRRPAAGW